MAQITLNLKTKRRWWVIPLCRCVVVCYWLAGQKDFDPRFIDWVVRHGIKIEVYP